MGVSPEKGRFSSIGSEILVEVVLVWVISVLKKHLLVDYYANAIKKYKNTEHIYI